MPISKTSVPVIASVLNNLPAAASSKGSPGVNSGPIAVNTYYGGMVSWSITNGSSNPSVAPALTIQVSTDSTNWRDLYTVGGDVTPSSVNTGAFEIPRGAIYMRAIGYSSTGAGMTNPVTVAVELSAVSGL